MIEKNTFDYRTTWNTYDKHRIGVFEFGLSETNRPVCNNAWIILFAFDSRWRHNLNDIINAQPMTTGN